MASASPTAFLRPARIGQTAFMGIAWGGVAVTVLFFAFRIMVRLKVFGRLHADDVLVLFAWLALLINTILWQFGQGGLYENIAASSGQLYPPPPGLNHATEQYLRKSIAVIIFFYTGIWSVKFSFLVFFKRLGHNVRNQSVVWWVVLAFTLAAYVICLGTIQYTCLVSSFDYIETRCARVPGPIKFERDTLRATTILDIITDIIIILVPINLLWKVQISLRKKLALGGIFCITVIIMLVATIRAVTVNSYSHELDETWLYMWSSIEQAVSITVACLASFPSLFAKTDQAKHQHLPERNNESSSESNSCSTFTLSRKIQLPGEGESDTVISEV